MDQVTPWLVALLLLLAVLALEIRRRYGNPYAVITTAIERITGLSMLSIVRGLGILTLVGWALIYLFYGGAGETGLGDLFEGIADRSGEAE